MPASPSPSGSSYDAALDAAAREVHRLAGDRFEVLGPLGQDSQRIYAFLARQAMGGDGLVVLKAVADDPFEQPRLEVISQLDASVPPPAGACPVCQHPFRDWNPNCPDCGAPLGGSPADSPEAQSALRAAVRECAQGVEVLGDMPRAVGGGLVFFARETAGGQIVALRLDQEESGPASRYAVAATRMMSPRMLYGTVGGPGQEGGSGVLRPPPRADEQTTVPSAPVSGYGVKTCPQCGDAFEGDLRYCPRDGSPLRLGASEGLIGHLIADRYRVLEKLGEGGMGRVYLAEHIHMGRRCAVKVMNPALLHDPDSISRFAREAANASRITHPNVAAIYDFGETADRIVYLAMELVEGGSLAQVLERERALSPRRAIAIGQQVANALTAAHEFGIVHRDLKPDNIMLARGRGGQDVVKVVDFGIAKARTGAKQTVTRTGFVVGTPAYMSPEQILGDDLDGRSDIYSLGCILYEILTGERAFAGPSGEVVIRKRLTENPPAPSRVRSDLGKTLDAIVMTAMARSPDQRFASAAELHDALQAAAANAPQAWGRPTTRESESAAAAATTSATAGAGSARATLPVPVGWEAAAAPVNPPRTSIASIHRRSTGAPSRIVLWAGLAAVVVALVVLFGWRTIGAGRGSSAPRAGIGVPEPPAAPAPPSSAAPAPTLAQPEGTERPGGREAAETAAAPAPSADVRSARRDSGGIYFTLPLPRGAQVNVDGSPRRVPPDGRLPVAAGTHTVAVRAPGYQAATKQVRVARGETSELAMSLAPEAPAPSAAVPSPAVPSAPAPEPATPSVSTRGQIVIMGEIPTDAVIRVDGTAQPPGTRVVAMPPGPHTVVVSAPGFVTDSTTLNVPEGGRADWLYDGNPTAGRAPPEAAAPPVAARESPTPPKPEPPRKPAATSPTSPPGDGAETGVRGAVAAYVQAINSRNVAQLRSVFPSMSAAREQEWRDLFGRDVSELKATASDIRIESGTLAQVEFGVTLEFRPSKGKPQVVHISNQATVGVVGTAWRFVTLVERGS